MKPNLLGIAALLLTAAGPGGSDGDPDGYAVRLPVTPAPGGGIQRLALPTAAIVAMRNPDGTDVRVFDARGRPVPIARIAPATQVKRTSLVVLPILGGRDMRMGARVSVRVDERGQARVAEVESGGAAGHDRTVLGALLDARGVGGAAERLDFDVDVPVGQPVRFTVEASPDLDRWRALGDRILYRAPGSASVSAQVSLGSAALDRDYLRVTWRATAPLIAPVTLRTAVLVSSGAKTRIAVVTRAPKLLDDHAFEFVAPAASISSLRIVPARNDGATAIRVLGRDDREQPWTPLANGIASADGAAMELGAAPRVIRIEADRRGPGFSAPPRLELGFTPHAIAFAASGQAPFVLTAGRKGAEDMFTPLDALSPTHDLAQARVASGSTITSLVLSAPDDSQGSSRQAVLWVTLLAAVALLGGLVWRSVRRPASAG
jgi:hypothetical protein